MQRVVAAVCLLVLGVAACGGNRLLTDYATEMEDAVAEMNARVDEIDVDLDEAPSVEAAVRLWDQRIGARETFVGVLRAIDPPESATGLHEAVLDIMVRLTAAEAAMVDRAADFDTVTDLGQIWTMPEGQAARAVDQEAVAICQSAQALLDDTSKREVLADVPWLSNEVKEVVDVVFGCTPEERTTSP